MYDKMQIVMDEEKIRREGIYDLDTIQANFDRVFVEKWGLKKEPDGFYSGTGSKDDFGKIGAAYGMLRDKDWFLDNVKTWLFHYSPDEINPDLVVVEDFKEACLERRKLRKSA